jgi:hypothetical protein
VLDGTFRRYNETSRELVIRDTAAVRTYLRAASALV